MFVSPEELDSVYRDFIDFLDCLASVSSQEKSVIISRHGCDVLWFGLCVYVTVARQFQSCFLLLHAYPSIWLMHSKKWVLCVSPSRNSHHHCLWSSLCLNFMWKSTRLSVLRVLFGWQLLEGFCVIAQCLPGGLSVIVQASLHIESFAWLSCSLASGLSIALSVCVDIHLLTAYCLLRYLSKAFSVDVADAILVYACACSCACIWVLVMSACFIHFVLWSWICHDFSTWTCVKKHFIPSRQG